MRLFLACKRHYTNKDLLGDRFGRLYHLPAQLTAAGSETLVVAADYRSRLPESLIEEGLSIQSVPARRWRLPVYVWRLWRSARRFRPDIVLASSDTPFGILGVLIARRLGVPFAFDVYDDYRQFASARIPGMRAGFRWVLRSADLVICAGKRIERLVHEHNSSTVVIPNGIDPSVFRPHDRMASRRDLGIDEGAEIVGFYGSIARNRGVDILTQSIAELRNRGRSTELLLAGANEIGLDLSPPWVHWRGLVDQTTVAALINASDVVVVPYLPDPQVSVSNANKIPEYLACGAPVVTTRVSDHAETFNLPSAITCRPGDAGDLTRAILGQLEQPTMVPLPPGFTWPELGATLATALDGLRSGSGAG